MLDPPLTLISEEKIRITLINQLTSDQLLLTEPLILLQSVPAIYKFQMIRQIWKIHKILT